MNSKPPSLGDQPRSEPEIIPPERGLARGVIWTSIDERGAHRIYVARPGPFSIALLLLAVAALAAIVGILLIGTFLIWVPVVALLIAVAAVSAWWRRVFQS